VKLISLSTVLLAGAVAVFVSEAKSAPHLQAPVFSPLSLQAGQKCKRVSGLTICTDKQKKNAWAKPPVSECPRTQTEAGTLRGAPNKNCPPVD
jgi:hypothetical protein